FHLEAGNTVTIKNGTITSDTAEVKMLIQNYCNLTLTDVAVDGSALAGEGRYVVSNNSGRVVINGSTSITAKDGDFALDACKFGDYEIPEVTIETSGTIAGKIEATGGKLEIKAGTINGTLLVDSNFSEGDVTKASAVELSAPFDYSWSAAEAGVQTLIKHALVKTSAKDATCTEAGNIAYWTCRDCNKIYRDAAASTEISAEDTVISATGHTEVTDKAVAATCTETGLTEGKHCSVCNEVLVAQEVVPATGHTEVTDKAVAATCTETGLTEGKHCSVCNEVLVAQKVVPAKGHLNLTHNTATDPTCTKNGNIENWYCEVCGKYFAEKACTTELTEEAITIPALKHTLVAVDAVAPTCDKAGNIAYWSCEECGKTFKDANGTEQIKYSERVIPATGHQNLTAHAAVEATCTAGGNLAYWTCDDCGKYFLDAEATEAVAKNDTKTEKLGHDMKHVPAVAHTCTVDGNVEYWTCDNCHKFFSDSKLSNEITEAETVDKAPGHLEVVDEAVPATCTETGLTEGKHCSVCNEVLVAQEVVPAAGHKYTDGICDVCGDKFFVSAVIDGEEMHFESIEAAVEAGAGTVDAPIKLVVDGQQYTLGEDEIIYIDTNELTIEVLATDDYVVESEIDENGITIFKSTKKTGLFDENDHVRYEGATRYETAIAVAEAFKKARGIEEFQNVIVASGENYPDALTGAYLGKVKDAPMILVKSKNEQTIADYIKENLAENGTVYILGDKQAVSDNFQKKLGGIAVKRLGGPTRYETNLLILKEAGVDSSYTGEILICSGLGFADSLSASATGKPILIVGKSVLNSQKEFLAGLASAKYYVIGGTDVVPEKIATALGAIKNADIERVSGPTRYETSTAVARTFFPDGAESVTLAYGRNFPDGLSGSALAMAIGSPLILAESTDRSIAEAKAYVEECGATRSVTLGSANLITDNARDKIVGNLKEGGDKLNAILQAIF
ncbi:MAG: cell wall-binding repeat-containing protein, partial [Firmicutes bacterium]|nr:cell wall-binding repeat-containing protein [Bacillota bacterium]